MKHVTKTYHDDTPEPTVGTDWRWYIEGCIFVVVKTRRKPDCYDAYMMYEEGGDKWEIGTPQSCLADALQLVLSQIESEYP